MFGLGTIENLDAYKAETRPRGSNASWQMAQVVTLWFMLMVIIGKLQITDAPQFLLIQGAVITPWMKYSFSRHINKHRTNTLAVEQDRIEAEHGVMLEDVQD